MAYIRKRGYEDGSEKYTVGFKDQHGRWRERVVSGNKRAAEAYLRRALEEVAKGTFEVEREDPTLKQFYERWITSKEKSLKASTLASYKSAFDNHVLPALGKKRLRNIRPLDVQAWVSGLAAGDLAPATVGRCYRYLRSCMKSAVAWEVISNDPFKKINLPRVNREELTFLDHKEIRKLLEKAKEPEKALFAVLALSGLRLGEALALQWKDIDFCMKAIYVSKSYSYWGGIQEPKTASSRRAVTLLPVLADMLLSHREHMKKHAPDDYLFQTRGLRPLDPANARKRFDDTLTRAKLKAVTLHSLRHSYASILLSSGASIKALQHALGHSSATMTLNVYSHLIEERMEEATVRMDALVRGVKDGKIVPLEKGKGRGE